MSSGVGKRAASSFRAASRGILGLLIEVSLPGRRGFLAALGMTLANSAMHGQAPTGTYVIRGGTVVPVVGAKIPNGTVVISGGKIQAVGASVAAPQGATVIDATGLFVYPGMIDSGTELGLTEIGSVPGSTDTREIGDFNPQDVALTAVNAHSELIPVTRVNGVTTVVTSATGALMSGSAALIDLWGWTPDEMAIKPRVAQVMSYPSSAGGRRGAGFGGRPQVDASETASRQVRAMRDFFADARAYAQVKAKLAAGGSMPNAPRVNQAMESLVPAMRGEMPIIFDVNTIDQIRGVLTLVDSFKLKVILRGPHDAWRVADTLAARGIPVIVGPTTQVPGTDDPYDAIYAQPGVLAKAGVKIAFQTSGASDVRDLPYNAALATAYGLDMDEAIKAVTINPAQIFGVADRYGSLEAGKVANVVVTTGNPLDVRSVVKYLFIRGDQVPLTDRHTKLYEEFRARPRP